ncbi:sigma 54-interacting transcriptional regulator [Fusibacter paucivorans]|uniref:Sigma 54-interacting transcriptional regulator n=1 Tax=Fusibacter paucivorans TaxID=76009 RepID=A0ABS5PJJ4_9FIRM|nr:sigma 54-interacting transcriptional regulator [Fusibacter paucivorans]MBS7525275.1 sigma 54-interacting transcriptional regulator [Fusibacter paucivorans]
MSKNILVVSTRKKAALFIKETLHYVIGDDINIIVYYFTMDNEPYLLKQLKRPLDVIVASGEVSYERISHYNHHVKTFIAMRDVSEPEYFDKVFLIPKGKRVLVANETEKGTYETIQALESLGITHLTYVPYWLNCDVDYSDIDIAISPGMLDICPPEIKEKIDIGMRQLAISFFIELLTHLAFDLNLLEKYLYKQKQLLISTYQKLSVEYLRAERLKDSLQTIINELDEAIIGVNQQHRITEFNKTAERLLHLRKEQVLHRTLQDVFKTKEPIGTFLSKHNNIVLLQDKQIFINFVSTTSDNISGGIYILREVKKLQESEEHVRRILYKKNYAYSARYHFEEIVARNSEMMSIIQNAQFLSKADSTILITGESGTGKEVLAQSIHNASPRRNQPFIAVNFAAMNDNLIESELFGYEEGAFTGAKKTGKKGLFELAHNGTIFLDEIGDSSLWVQSRLLRVLEEKEIMRLGDTKIIPVDVRVIVATNKNLLSLIKDGKFREDLYYRLNVFKVHIPPLRERKEDIQPLIRAIMRNYQFEKTFSEQAEQLVMAYHWPGNIRELRNMVEYVAVKTQGDTIDLTDLPYDLLHSKNISSEIAFRTDEITKLLLQSFDPFVIRFVLRIASENLHAPTKIGRSRIKLLLAGHDITISDSNLKTLLKYLSEYGLVSIGKTKQGMVITPAGETFLAKF